MTCCEVTTIGRNAKEIRDFLTRTELRIPHIFQQEYKLLGGSSWIMWHGWVFSRNKIFYSFAKTSFCEIELWASVQRRGKMNLHSAFWDNGKYRGWGRALWKLRRKFSEKYFLLLQIYKNVKRNCISFFIKISFLRKRQLCVTTCLRVLKFNLHAWIKL